MLLAVAVVMGYLLLVFVYLIPTDLMHNQVVNTAIFIKPLLLFFEAF